MVISTTPEPELSEFKQLIYDTNKKLNDDAKNRETYYLNRSGEKLEGDVYDILNDLAKSTPFENTIELISGVKFPDIITKKLYGVEVKSTTQNHWTTAGNSVLEGNRVASVKRIFMLFGKLTAPIEFKCKPYEECLAEVRVTHSPRYMINMDLPKGGTIFDKLDISYNELRQLENPITPIVNYYKAHLKGGESLWWMDNNSATPMTVRLWSALDRNEKISYVIKCIVYYPEIFGNSNRKYDRFTLDLVTKEGIISTSMRDSFTAGGQQDIITAQGLFKNLPRIYKTVNDNINQIIAEILSAEPSLLEKHWGIKLTRNRFNDWLKIVSAFANDAKNTRFLQAILIKYL